ncbi:nucleotidyltransferase domain-containing protein [Tritonibacter mobilis]|uniref:Polymerase nucleotidyl transferase domain-containing protein n=1 Tax=Tritonibacter mobilis F1926 TaxID=1265309 RepID=A0A1B1A725_9RHOB|nr:nucleotidyltransferase domain-containing protein [Tritonibacter mobilis]ANP42382.1 hypothetical protein K529_016520 [Tritonibacter mobilis F1926]KJZ22694.1 hypothetical protein TW79_17210 [Tritonibacter mobilis]
MNAEKLDLSHLQHQEKLVQSAYAAFADNPEVVAIVLLGSLAKGAGDRVSDADLVVFTQDGFHMRASHCFETFEADKDIFYRLEGENDQASFKKYIFTDLTSAEIHCIDTQTIFPLAHPHVVLMDKGNIVAGRLTDEAPPQHADFPVYTSGDDGLIWELFDCIKWLSRGNSDLAKGYLLKLAGEIQRQV